MKTLYELAKLAAIVDEKTKDIKRRADTPQLFVDLQAELNDLQLATPGYKGTTKARTVWMNHGLDSFDLYVVKPTKDKTPGWDRPQHSIPGLLMTYDTCRFFLERHYLGDGFRDVYERVEKTLKSLVKATKDTNQHGTWIRELESLQDSLMQGRL